MTATTPMTAEQLNAVTEAVARRLLETVLSSSLLPVPTEPVVTEEAPKAPTPVTTARMADLAAAKGDLEVATWTLQTLLDALRASLAGQCLPADLPKLASAWLPEGWTFGPASLAYLASGEWPERPAPKRRRRRTAKR